MSVTLSSKYQIVIPKQVRRKLGMKPGQKFNVEAGKNGSVVIKPDVDARVEAFMAHLEKYAGILKTEDTAWGKAGMDAAVWLRQERDRDD